MTELLQTPKPKKRIKRVFPEIKSFDDLVDANIVGSNKSIANSLIPSARIKEGLRVQGCKRISSKAHPLIKRALAMHLVVCVTRIHDYLTSINKKTINLDSMKTLFTFDTPENFTPQEFIRLSTFKTYIKLIKLYLTSTKKINHFIISKSAMIYLQSFVNFHTACMATVLKDYANHNKRITVQEKDVQLQLKSNNEYGKIFYAGKVEPPTTVIMPPPKKHKSGKKNTKVV